MTSFTNKTTEILEEIKEHHADIRSHLEMKKKVKENIEMNKYILTDNEKENNFR